MFAMLGSGGNNTYTRARWKDAKSEELWAARQRPSLALIVIVIHNTKQHKWYCLLGCRGGTRFFVFSTPSFGHRTNDVGPVGLHTGMGLIGVFLPGDRGEKCTEAVVFMPTPQDAILLSIRSAGCGSISAWGQSTMQRPPPLLHYIPTKLLKGLREEQFSHAWKERGSPPTLAEISLNWHAYVSSFPTVAVGVCTQAGGQGRHSSQATEKTGRTTSTSSLHNLHNLQSRLWLRNAQRTAVDTAPFPRPRPPHLGRSSWNEPHRRCSIPTTFVAQKPIHLVL